MRAPTSPPHRTSAFPTRLRSPGITRGRPPRCNGAGDFRLTHSLTAMAFPATVDRAAAPLRNESGRSGQCRDAFAPKLAEGSARPPAKGEPSISQRKGENAGPPPPALARGEKGHRRVGCGAQNQAWGAHLNYWERRFVRQASVLAIRDDGRLDVLRTMSRYAFDVEHRE
jgi:hypothetical protein